MNVKFMEGLGPVSARIEIIGMDATTPIRMSAQSQRVADLGFINYLLLNKNIINYIR
jgi:hypothetical protein